MTDQDKADLTRAEEMVTEGKRLRQRVLSRIRVRKMRNRQAKPTTKEIPDD